MTRSVAEPANLELSPACTGISSVTAAAGELGSEPLLNPGDPPAVLTLLLGSQSTAALACGVQEPETLAFDLLPRARLCTAAGAQRRPPLRCTSGKSHPR